MIKAIFYDFDGVIKESLEAKAEAFYTLYLPYGKTIAEQVRRHHLAHGGMSRFEKFKIYHRDFLGQPLSASEAQALGRRFSQLVVQKVIEAEYVKGAREALIQLNQRYLQFLLTATPAEEIQRIADALQITPYFRAIYGFPPNKKEMAYQVIKDFHLHPETVLFVGDALTDYQAATAWGLHFVLREHPTNRDVFRDKNVKRIHDLTELPTIIENL